MADHVVEQIAERFRTLLDRNTVAYNRVYRDRGYNFEDVDDLPAIDIRIGEDNPVDAQVQNFWTSEVQINVDLYVRDATEYVSSTLLELRKETYKLLMAGMPTLPGVAAVKMILPGGATEVAQSAEGLVPVAQVRTVYFVEYRHSLTDPSQ